MKYFIIDEDMEVKYIENKYLEEYQECDNFRIFRVYDNGKIEVYNSILGKPAWVELSYMFQ